MKLFKIKIVIGSLALFSCGNGVQTNSNAEFKVWGNCGMCEETIESSLKVPGVGEADWNKDTKMIKVSYDSTRISLDEIKKKIASAGYDNDAYQADDAVYSTLHECCQYDRKK